MKIDKDFVKHVELQTMFVDGYYLKKLLEQWSEDERKQYVEALTEYIKEL